jgi:hypothetical protein
VGGELPLEAGLNHPHHLRRAGVPQSQDGRQSQDAGRRNQDVRPVRESHRAGSVLGASADAHHRLHPAEAAECNRIHRILVRLRAGRGRRSAVRAELQRPEVAERLMRARLTASLVAVAEPGKRGAGRFGA